MRGVGEGPCGVIALAFSAGTRMWSSLGRTTTAHARSHHLQRRAAGDIVGEVHAAAIAGGVALQLTILSKEEVDEDADLHAVPWSRVGSVPVELWTPCLPFSTHAVMKVLLISICARRMPSTGAMSGAWRVAVGVYYVHVMTRTSSGDKGCV